MVARTVGYGSIHRSSRLLLAVALVPVLAGAGSASDAIEIYPGENIQAHVDANPPGTAFLLKAGVHRPQTIRPQNGNSFTGESGTVLSGAQELISFNRSGDYWVAFYPAPDRFRSAGECQDGYVRCTFPEDLFIDDQPLRHVGSLGEVGPGAWYFDYDAAQVYVADDPEGRHVEIGVTAAAFEPTGDDVTISRLTIEKYANQAQQGAIGADGTVGWVIFQNHVRLNHGVGIRTGTRAQLIGNNIHHNGQLGIGGGGTNVLVQDNEIAYNNTAHYLAAWEAGGAKFAFHSNLTVRWNYVHDNAGPGLWTDIDNVDTAYAGNLVEDNAGPGIYHEISYRAIICNNVVRRNGYGSPDYVWGAGILVAASPDVEIFGNLLEDNADGIAAVQQDRGWGSHGAHEVRNLWVHDNTLLRTPGWTGVVQDISDLSVFTSRNIVFEGNHYQLDSDGYHFAWMDGERSESEWVSYGHDLTGTFSR
jgi:hypothetical protein